MESSNVLETYNHLDTDLKENFIESVNSKMRVKTNYEKKDFDYSWIDIFEESLYYIDNIIRNPKRFIINEEEVVKIEQSKRVTVESIIHLTQHTNLIKDYDPKKSEVTPSKILNVNKEESLDTYENRFIYTLIKQMNLFLETNAQKEIVDTYCYDDKNVQYDATTKIENEDVKISLTLESSDHKNKAYQMDANSMKQKIERIKLEVHGFMNSELYKTLEKLHVPEVRPPIRKTNVILKNANFHKANDLWDFLHSFNKNEFEVVKDNQDYMETGYAKEQFDESFLINYLTLNTLAKKSEKNTVEKVLTMAIGRMIESILDTEGGLTYDKFMDLINKEYKKAKNIVDDRDQSIINVLESYFNKINKQMSNVTTILDKR